MLESCCDTLARELERVEARVKELKRQFAGKLNSASGSYGLSLPFSSFPSSLHRCAA